MLPMTLMQATDVFTIGVFRFRLCACCCSAQPRCAEKHPPAKPIDLNVANVKELQELPGVGPVTAQRIIDMRQKSGRFSRVEDLLAVRGISQKKLDAMRPYVTVSAPPPRAPPAQKSSPPAKKSESSSFRSASASVCAIRNDLGSARTKSAHRIGIHSTEVCAMNLPKH